MKAEIIGTNLVITIEMEDRPRPSATGKTLVVASSHGNQPTGAVVDGQPVIVGVNAYIRAGYRGASREATAAVGQRLDPERGGNGNGHGTIAELRQRFTAKGA